MKRYAPWVLAAVLLSLLMLGRSGATLPVAALGLAVATLLYLVGSRWHLFHRLARSRMRDRIELDSLSDDLIGVVIQTMQPAHASLWLRGRASAPSGPSAAEDGKDATDGGSVTIRRR